MKSFITRDGLDATDIRDFVIISIFVGTMLIWCALGSGA